MNSKRMENTPKGGHQAIRAVVVVFVAGILFALWYFSRPTRPEPVYQGRRLTSWLKQLDDGEAFGISSSRPLSLTSSQLEAASAIHAMGTNALPFLMDDLHARPTEESRRVRFYRWSNKHLPDWLHSTLFPSMDTTEEDRIRWRAAQGLSALGARAKPALPELKRLLFTNFWHSSIKESAYALAAIRPEGIDILTNSIQTNNEWSGMCAIWALGQHPDTGTNCIPFLIQCTKSSSQGTAEGAIEVLGLFHTEAAQVVPVLTNLLTSPNTQLSTRAAISLGRFGKKAAEALPLLQNMTNAPATRDAALQAIRQIR